MEIVSCHTTSTTEKDAFPSNAMEEIPKPEDLLPLGINDFLTLSREVKDTIIQILKNDDVSTIVTSPTKACDSCCMSISFSDEDLLLVSKLHNRPLYVSGYVREQKLNQILIDNGSAVNILAKSTMNKLGISVEELSNSKLVIQGFNQGAQRAIGTVHLEIVIEDLQASTIFHGIKKVDVDSRSFTKAKPHFANAKFYTKSEDVSEVISTEVPMTKGTFKNEQEMITSKKSNKGDALNSQQNDESTTETKSRVPEAEKIATLQKEVSNPPVLRYIPLSRLFQRVSTSIAEDNNQASTWGSTRLSAFQRLNTNAKKVQSISPTPTTRKSAFKRLSVSVTRGQKKASISVSNKSSLVTGDEEIRSVVPSRMKRKMFVSVNTEGSLKVKRHDVVFTRPKDNEPEDEVDVAGCCHVTIEETSDHDIFEEDAEAARLSLEDGGRSTIDELKEVNLGSKEEPRPTFISTQLSNNDENEYVNLLKAYKDFFAWSYKEMSRLDPKVAVHRSAIKPEHQPVKQAQR
ncbi:gag protease polyprotein [Cucumis melo var. makuwa]|uniref:Gag protease polyprotein n=1 Tax=Cucumis melo var. makuwa TaxID=1194695 RepID=A0A5A7VGW0_CUCMM|nr:gag protease polyprotein [Cucumis melo var. makuwa]TYK30247.1 gag protease polyprotein [Cucumis melo var. makuwa]